MLYGEKMWFTIDIFHIMPFVTKMWNNNVDNNWRFKYVICKQKVTILKNMTL